MCRRCSSRWGIQGIVRGEGACGQPGRDSFGLQNLGTLHGLHLRRSDIGKRSGSGALSLLGNMCFRASILFLEQPVHPRRRLMHQYGVLFSVEVRVYRVEPWCSMDRTQRPISKAMFAFA